MFQQELIDELKEKFEETKKELGFKSSFDEINEVFFINDFILHEKFVSEFFSRQLCRRIADTYNSWVGYLHGLMVPNPSNMLTVMENKMLEREEKDKVSDLIKKALILTSENTLIGLQKDKKREAKFIDDSIKLWKDYFKPELIKIMEKLNKGWREEK